MSKDSQSIRNFLKNFKEGQYESKNVKTQIDAGWYDWFCKDSSLYNKTKVLAEKLLSILPSYKIDIDKQFVFFKNNCPCVGSLYDDFRICDLKSGDVIWTITPKGNKGQSEVWGRENGFEKPIISGTWSEVLNFFREF